MWRLDLHEADIHLLKLLSQLRLSITETFVQ